MVLYGSNSPSRMNDTATEAKNEEEDEDEKQKYHSMMGDSATDATLFSSKMADHKDFIKSMKKTEDLRSLFSVDELSNMTLEQKILSGLFIPKQKKEFSSKFI